MEEFLQQSVVAAHIVFLGALTFVVWFLVRGLMWLTGDLPRILRDRFVKRDPEADRETREAFVDAMIDGARREQQRQIREYRMRHGVQATDNEIALLLAGIRS